jgi:hypothetical protein
MADELTITVGKGTPPARKIYEVLAESGLFKGGVQYNKGDQVELNIEAAANFLNNNDIKEVTNG